jgi:hypothetical protein
VRALTLQQINECNKRAANPKRAGEIHTEKRNGENLVESMVSPAITIDIAEVWLTERAAGPSRRHFGNHPRSLGACAAGSRVTMQETILGSRDDLVRLIGKLCENRADLALFLARGDEEFREPHRRASENVGTAEGWLQVMDFARLDADRQAGNPLGGARTRAGELEFDERPKRAQQTEHASQALLRR